MTFWATVRAVDLTSPFHCNCSPINFEDLLSELDIERCAVVGFSLGGMINRRFAMGHPERTSALVILNSPHERTAEAQQLVEERVRDTAMGGPGATIDTSLKRWFTPQFLATDDPIIHKVQTWILGNDPQNLYRGSTGPCQWRD